MESVIDFNKASHVLIIKPSSFGDVLHTLPALGFLRAAHPGLKVDWLVNTEWMPLINDHPLLDRVIEFPRRQFRGLRGMLSFRSWNRRFREECQPDIVLDFQGLLRSALLGKFCGAPDRVGMSDGREGSRLFYNHVIEVDPDSHAVDRNLTMLRGCGISTDGPVRFPLGPGRRPERQASGLPESFLLLHPFSRGAGKSLSMGQVNRLARNFREKGIPVVLVGMGESEGLEPGPVSLLNQTSLAELIWLIGQAGFVVSVDSGPMHLAAALERPLIGIHTWSNPAKVGPYGGRSSWVWKGGRIARRSEFDADELEAEMPFTDGDLPALADFVVERFQNSPSTE